MKNTIYILSILIFLSACSKKKPSQEQNKMKPVVSENGTQILFSDENSVLFFTTEKINKNNLTADFIALGKIAATVLTSSEGASQNIILFENPDLASNYTQLIQHQIGISQIQNINIKQLEIELERIKDLRLHGAATGQELLNAQTALSLEKSNLSNEKTALIEHEAMLKSGGFNPDIFRKAKAGTAYVICDIPENQINKIEKGGDCEIRFIAYPDEVFTGKIDGVGDVVNNATRMIKLRISVNNSSSKLKAGMFTTVSFGLNKGDFISIDKNSLVTVQGKSYVFSKINAHSFERKEIEIGQQIGDRIIVFNGLNNEDEIAIKGVMQLKGLSFGY